MIQPENIEEAIKTAAKDKGSRKAVQRVMNNLPEYIEKTRQMLLDFSYVPKIYAEQNIREGSKRKKRKISKQPFWPDQVIHSCVLGQLTPILMNSIYEYAHGSLKERGTDQSKEAIERWIQNDPKNTKYCLQMDIHHCYPSIEQEILVQLFRNIIHDYRFNRVNEIIIHTSPEGLIMGAKPSFIYLHFLLSELDHKISEMPGAKHFLRHADDFIILGSSKRELRKIQNFVIDYIREERNMQINPNYSIFPIEYVGKDGKKHGRPLDTCGYLFYRDRTILREAKMLSITRKAKKISKKPRMTRYDAQQMMGRIGWLRQARTYHMYLERVKPYVRKKQLRKILSKYGRQQNARMEVSGECRKTESG